MNRRDFLQPRNLLRPAGQILGAVDEVRALTGGTYRKIILEPYPPLGDAKVALTSWRWLLKLQSVDQIQVVQFVRSHYADPNYAPEANIQ